MKKYLLVIFIFLFIYFPPFKFLNTLHVLGIISWIIIFIKFKKIYKIIINSKVLGIASLLLITNIYILIVLYFNGGDISLSFQFIFLLVDIIPSSVVISYYCISYRFTPKQFLIILLVVGNIQGGIAIITFMIHPIQSAIIENLISYGFSDIYRELSMHRMYGYSYNFTYTLPIVQAVLAVLAIYMALTIKFKYILFVPSLVFSAIINARTSIVVLLLGILLILCRLHKFSKIKIKNIMISIILSIMFLIFIFPIIKQISPITYNWIIDGKNEVVMFLQGKQTGYFEYGLNEEKFILPKDFGLIWGKGSLVMGTYNGVQSDIGFINDIWFGGIIYLLLVYGVIIKLLLNLYKCTSKDSISNKFLATFFAFVFVIANIKGIAFSTNEMLNLFFISYVYIKSSSSVNI
jgi:hypothetical protein